MMSLIILYYKYKKQLPKIEKKVGWSTKKHTNKGSKDGNKGQGSSLLLCVLRGPQSSVVYSICSQICAMTILIR